MITITEINIRQINTALITIQTQIDELQLKLNELKTVVESLQETKK